MIAVRTRLVASAVAASILSVTVASAGITPTSNPSSLASAMSRDSGTTAGAAFVSVPAGAPHGIGDSPLGAGFPTHNTSFAILSTGDASLADDPNGAGDDGAELGGLSVRGDTDFDVSILRIDLAVPAAANCLRIDFQFLSEEYPEFVGTGYNDAFIAEVNGSTWTTSGSTITSPDNFAIDPSGDLISINSTGSTAMSAAHAGGTTYDGASPLLRASAPIPPGDGNGALPGTASLYLSIFDQGDEAYDSAVFVDRLALDSVPNPAIQCRPGVAIPTDLRATPAIAELSATGPSVHFPNLSARLTDAFAGSPIQGKPIEFYPNGGTSLICSATTNPQGVASCGGLSQELQAVLAFGYTAVFPGAPPYGANAASARLVRVFGTDLP